MISFHKVFAWPNVKPKTPSRLPKPVNIGLCFGLLLTILFFFGCRNSYAQDKTTEDQNLSSATRNAHYRLTYDSISLPGKETMGLLGSYLLWEPTPNSYFGLGIFSALEGKRGGFFTGGLEAGWRPRLMGQNLYFDAGLFAGAGGGGGAPQGGGLMFRPHLGLVYDAETYRLGVQRSSVLFPNGDIDSEQWSLNLEIPFKTHWLTGWGAEYKKTLPRQSYDQRTRTLLVKLHRLSPDSASQPLGGGKFEKELGLMGIELQTYFSDHGFSLFAVDGAWEGGIDGYAQVQAGLGYHWPLNRSNHLLVSASLGGAGGGGVNTGGGVTAELELAYRYMFSRQWGWQLGAGYFSALDGDFDNQTLSLASVYEFQRLNPVSGNGQTVPAAEHLWRVQGAIQSYYPVGNTRRKNGLSNDQRIDLMGLSIETAISRSCFINGQALGAYGGEAGGYAVGLLGLACESHAPESGNWATRAELFLGAAGGGGLAVGDGLIGQAMLGLNYYVSDRFNVLVSAGYVESLSGTFQAYVSNIGLAYRFSTLQLD